MTVNRRDLLVKGGATAGLAAAAAASANPVLAQAQTTPSNWDREADVVVIGSGATGMPAAIVAREAGASVILVEAQPHIGGHAICSGGNLPLGGGNSYQKKYGIEDSADLFFQDLTDWSVVEPNGSAPYRYNDREIMRAFADNSVADVRVPACARRQGDRARARPPGRPRGRALGAAHPALRDHGLAPHPERQA